MSKFGWSYPPGVTESMLPGNSKEDQEAEAFWDTFFEVVEDHARGLNVKVPDEQLTEKLVEWVWKQISEAYSKGYADGMSDEGMARDAAIEQMGESQ